MHRKDLLEIIEKQKGKRILVIGDLMLDRFITGKVSRISPEAPVPIVNVESEENKLGGAGNVVQNIKALGGEPILISVVGEDTEAETVKRILKNQQISSEGIISIPDRPTIIKTRIIADRQQVVRLDYEKDHPLNGNETKRITSEIARFLDNVDAVIVSDYNKGLITADLMAFTTSKLPKDKIISVDPKPSNYRNYKNVSVLTPNLKETSEMSVMRIESDSDLIEAARHIFKELNCKSLLVTLGARGMAVFENPDGEVHKLETRAHEVYDVTGAGDTVIAAFTLAMSAGAPMFQAAELANYAAGIVVGKLGTATASIQELGHYINTDNS
jgi:rfaE bifunctional protein kinase chain/domain